MRWDITIERRTRNRLNTDTTRRKLKRIAAAAERNKALGFTGRAGVLHEPVLVTDPATNEEVHRYLVKIRLEKPNVRSQEAAEQQYLHVLKVVSKCANCEGWEVVQAPGMGGQKPQGSSAADSLAAAVRPARPARAPFSVPPLDDNSMAELLSGIYQRDSHVRVIHDAATNYFETRRRNELDPSVEICRSHVLLKGKPAGCKTKLFERFKQWFEKGGEVERVKFIDAHVMTKAGLENYLLELAEDNALPEIIVLEEIEKQSPDNLLALVSVMGSGYISKLNARIGHRRELANVLVWATCNQEDIIRQFRAGVLWSRFAHKLHCTRPNRELMRRILLDQVSRMGGNPAWADRAIEFAYDHMPKLNGGKPMDDPREIKGLLDGRDRLLDNTYQLDLLAIIQAQLEEAKSEPESMSAA